MDYYICVLDFEATCEENNRNYLNEIIEFPSVLWKVHCKPDAKPSCTYVSEIQNYVKPVVNKQLTPFCTQLTGITQETVDKFGISFLQAFKLHFLWLSANVPNGAHLIIATCGNWDLQTMLPKQLKTSEVFNLKCVPQIYNEWANMKWWFQNVNKKDRAPGMAGMLKSLGLNLEGRHHSGIDDCKNIWRIIQKLIDKGLNLQKEIKYQFVHEEWPHALVLE